MTKQLVVGCILATSIGLGTGLIIAKGGDSGVPAKRELATTVPRTEDGRARYPDPSRDENEADPDAPPRAMSRRVAQASEKEEGTQDKVRAAQLAREVERLKKREAETRLELEAAKQQVEAHETLQKSFAPREFDLGPEDWRRLRDQGTLKLRIPCPVSPGNDLTKQQLDHLGLVPEDAPVITAAFQHSAERVWTAIGPLCAQVLGTTPELAAARGPNMCRRLILRDAAQKGTALPAFQRAAAVLAGDAPAPADPSPVESVILSLAREQDKLEAELSEYFGPAEADRLVFSDGLCFTEATHQLNPEKTAAARP
jgi:hypothetical protein